MNESPPRLPTRRAALGVKGIGWLTLMLVVGWTGFTAPAGAQGETQSRPPDAVAPETAAPAAPTTATTVAPVASPDPIVERVRARLADSPRAAGDRKDRDALASFYKDHEDGALWVTTAGATARGQSVIAEIGKAADWGLAAADFKLPAIAQASPDAAIELRADEEIAIGLAVLRYARHARGGRLDPASLSRFFDQKPPVKPADAVLREIAAASDAGAYLRGLHPQHRQFEALRQSLIKVRSGNDAPATSQVKSEGGPDITVKVAVGPAVKAGKQHASVADLRKRLGVPSDDASKSDVLDAKLVDALKRFQREADLTVSGTLDKSTRAALNKAPKVDDPGAVEARLIANMERWRWLPEDMGAFHVWDNIPEQAARVVKGGETIHQARIVVGKVETQTPLFSADMRYIVFHPGWGVPDSIKVKEILPYLRSTQSFFGFGETDTAVLRRHGLTVNLNGKPVDAATINWQQVDIRRYSFVQPPGASNVLGLLKFRFPNKHDVYMHDTSQRELFQRTQRTFSHGCVRVENPQRLAEVLLDQDRGMPASEIARLLSSGPKDNQIELKTKIPVHITYFTAVAAPDGTIKTFPDFYGHDARVTAALAGKPLALERGSEVAEAPRRPAKAVRQASKSSGGGDFFAGLFGN